MCYESKLEIEYCDNLNSLSQLKYIYIEQFAPVQIYIEHFEIDGSVSDRQNGRIQPSQGKSGSETNFNKK